MRTWIIVAAVLVAAPAAAKPLCQPAKGLLLPTFGQSPLKTNQKDGKLVIEGTVTSLSIAKGMPAGFPLADGRTLVQDPSNMFYLWDPSTKVLTELRRGMLHVVPRMGALLVDVTGDTVRFFDVDPDRTKPGFREIWKTRSGDRDTLPRVIGTLDGAIAIDGRKLVGDTGYAPTVTITCISGPGKTTKLTANIGAKLSIAGGDALRDHRALLVGPIPSDPAAVDVDAAIFDLDTRKVRPLAKARAARTTKTQLSTRYIKLHWSDHDGNVADDPKAETRASVVDVSSETVTP